MCGICGIVSQDPASAAAEPVLLAMRDILAHRGPDDAGLYMAPGVALGCRRLAILDLSERGHMPMATPDGRFWITYNGEIYNFRDLRRELESRGYVFRSNTDTEVLLCLYAADGPAMLNRLNGMFAFAIWDNQERSLFAARDRLGIKPLYYARHKGALYFASEEKALFAAGVPARFDHACWGEMLCFRYVAGEATPFSGVRRLLPGHYLVFQDGEVRIRTWWNLAERVQALRENLPADPVSWYRETFDDAVSLRLISDVPVGVLLSGGLDSSSVAASLASRVGPGMASFTVRFDQPAYDEGPLAQQVARRYGFAYHDLRVAASDLAGLLRQASWFNNQPLAHGNDLHLLAISRHAKPRVTVLLSGEGGDETLGGYVRYRPLRFPVLLRKGRHLLPSLSSAFRFDSRFHKLTRFLKLGSPEQMVLYNACDALPSDLEAVGVRPPAHYPYREQIQAEAQRLYPGDLERQAMYIDQHTFLCSVLDRNDRMTMGASIECRVPFLDYRLVEMAAALPSPVLLAGWRGKKLLRDSVGSRLPSAVLNHRKWGFGVPWKNYLREVEELRSLLLDLPNAGLLLDSPLDRPAVREQIQRFLAGDDRPFFLLLQLLMSVLAWEVVSAGSPERLPIPSA